MCGWRRRASLALFLSFMLSTTPLRTLRTHASAGRGLTTKRFASHGAPHYNEPTGYLFGEKVRTTAFCPLLPINFALAKQPPAPGQKRVKEDWENIWYFGMFGSIGLAALLLYYKPDTRCASVSLAPFRIRSYTGTRSIQGWALKEAKARMDARGEKVHYESPPL